MPPEFHISRKAKSVLADTVTPMTLYLKLRDQFPCTLLLESNDYRGSENSLSFICCNPIATFKVNQGHIYERFPDGRRSERKIEDRREVLQYFEAFIGAFKSPKDDPASHLGNGIFGYCSYDAIEYFEDIELQEDPDTSRNIPPINYSLYQHVLVFNHFKSELTIIESEIPNSINTRPLDVELLLKDHNFPTYPFETIGEEESNMTDEEHLQVIESCKKHIFRGDVFQIVPSRRFSQKYSGDDFNVYRALRSINPSPYLFYFDYGDFRIFGSSPEAEILISNNRASIYPIAGTYKRTGDEKTDASLAETLSKDPKEGAEHVMLVDLARNDLSKHCADVRVDSFKEIQFYSHVIHLVSKVSGKLFDGASSISILADTFPAGTLSGAPKHRAMQLIDKYEGCRRSFYGGCLGYLGFNGDCVHAIIIRSFLSKDGVLHSRAGGGVVMDSVPESEVAEVRNKLGALKRAIQVVKEIV